MSFSLGEVIFILGAIMAVIWSIFVTIEVIDKKKLPNEMQILLDYTVPMVVWIVLLVVYDALQKKGWL